MPPLRLANRGSPATARQPAPPNQDQTKGRRPVPDEGAQARTLRVKSPPRPRNPEPGRGDLQPRTHRLRRLDRSQPRRRDRGASGQHRRIRDRVRGHANRLQAGRRPRPPVRAKDVLQLKRPPPPSPSSSAARRSEGRRTTVTGHGARCPCVHPPRSLHQPTTASLTFRSKESPGR